MKILTGFRIVGVGLENMRTSFNWAARHVVSSLSSFRFLIKARRTLLVKRRTVSSSHTSDSSAGQR